MGNVGTPTRTRKPYDDLPGSKFVPHPTVDHVEIDNKMKEIMEMSGVICINGQKYKTSIEDLELLGELGSGTCGHVVKMLHKPTQCVMAVKQMRWSGDLEENKRITMDLDVVLKSHDCNYIVNCYGVFINDADVWICMELMATCFDKLLKRLSSPIPEDILGKVALATVKALHYLKERHDVIHRDIKPSNILLDTHGNVKLCDFGVSGRLVNSKAKSGNPGCAAYMSPERIQPPNGSPDYDIRADVWSLGITLVELATGQFPYTDCNSDFAVLSRVLQDDPPSLPIDSNFTPEFHYFINSCLTKDYHQRPKYKRLLQYPFLTRYETKYVDVASWYAEATAQTARLTPNPGRKRSILFWSGDKKKRDPSPVAIDYTSTEQPKTKSESDRIKGVWSSILKSPFFHRRKKSVDNIVRPQQPPNNNNEGMQCSGQHTSSLPGNTSPIVLQRFLHQQIQHINGLRRVHRSTSISPTPRFGTSDSSSFEKDLLSEMKRLRLEDHQPSRIANPSPSPEPPPRINKMVSPLLLRRIAYNNVPEADLPNFINFNMSPCLHRCGIPPQGPARRRPYESNSVPCSPLPQHRYCRGGPSPQPYTINRT